MGKKRFSKVSVVSLVPDLILSIIYGHVLFLFLVVLFFRLFFIKKKNPKNIENFQKDKNVLFCVLFYLFLWRNLNNMCYINAKLNLILSEYVLICTYTQGLIKKFIFLVCVPSID